MQVKLKGLSRRGKTRISEHGDTFRLVREDVGGTIHIILVESLKNTWRGEKWLGWFEIGKEVEIID